MTQDDKERELFKRWASENLPIDSYGTPYCTEENNPYEIWQAARAPLIADLAAAMEALEFYASPSDYKAPLTGGMGKLYYDCGNTARRTPSPAYPTTGRGCEVKRVSDEIDALLRFYGGRKLISVKDIFEFSETYNLVQKSIKKEPNHE